jgi:uncharacterized protein
MRLGLAAALFVMGCGGAAPCPPATRLPARGGPFLWEVSGERGTLTLFGTFHAAGKEHIPDAALDRLRAAKLFVSEIPPVRLEPAPGPSLEEALGPETWRELRDATSGVIGEKQLRHAPPWLAMAAVTAASIDAPEVPMDAALFSIAQRRNLPFTTLESAEEQTRALDAGVTVDDLRQALAERRGMRCAVRDLVGAYRDGDGAAVRAALAGDAEATLLVERNRRWLPIIEGLVPEGAFVAVGVSHLVGEGSLPALLAERGYRVTRLGR